MNPFAETELLGFDDQVQDQNPYHSPAGSGKGLYDWTLAKQAAAWVAAIAIGYLAIGAIGSWDSFRRDPNHRHEPLLNTIVEFATDWRDGNGMD